MTNESKAIRFTDMQVKADGDTMTVAGFGSTFGGEPDSYGDVVAPGAYAKTLQENGLPKMLWQHDPREPIGKWIEAREDGKGLFLVGQFANTTKGRDAYELAKMGAIDSMSIGYSVRDAVRDQKTGIRTLKQIDLHEVSLVTFPANENAIITNVKETLPKTIREFEELLRDAGFTSVAAKKIAAGGFKAQDDARDEPDLKAIHDQLIAFTHSIKDFYVE